MRLRTLTLALALLTACASPLAAQERPDPAVVLRATWSDLALVRDLALMKLTELTKTSRVLGGLLATADSLSSGTPSMSIADALRRLEDVEALLEKEPVLPEPVPSTVRRVRLLLTRPGTELAPMRARAELFVVLNPLEEHLVQLSESAIQDASGLESLASSLHQSSAGLRTAALPAVRTLVQARRLALE